MKLSEFLDHLDILGAKPSRDYVGKMSDNPAMVLEEKVPVFTKFTDLEDLHEGVRIFEEKVCVQGFPARFSPQFWLAHAALTTWYKVLESYLQRQSDEDESTTQQQCNEMLFHLWVSLISAGPGSSHLEMMDVILKNETFLLWKYMEILSGEKLLLLVNTLRTNFVYQEDVPVDHYATLMETHIDKIFRSILSAQQMEECRRPILDLSLFYHKHMNHVPPHIGPRLSHLCFLICTRYPLENPYVGVDDWVLTRNHLRVLKDVAVHTSFRISSEAQYRVPRTLEKIFEAAVLDNMLEIMFKDFMNFLLQVCNYGNCRQCKRLFAAYQNGLFEKLDFKKGFEKRPDWLFDQCIAALTQLASLNTLTSHMDAFIIAAEQLCLLKFTKLSLVQISYWHKLIVNHVVSGRALLVKEARLLITCALLQQAEALNWKTGIDTGRMLVDIISDTPCTFIQDNEDSSLTDTIQQYANFLQQLIAQFRDQCVTGKYTDVIERCVLKCTDHVKAPVSLVCINSQLCDFMDANYIKELLFTLDKTVQEIDLSNNNTRLMEALDLIFIKIYSYFREKGYIAVDYNSLLMSICVACLSVQEIYTEDGQVVDVGGVPDQLYTNIVKEFVALHHSKGTMPSLAPLVPQLVQVIQDAIQMGTSYSRCAELLDELGTREIKILTDYTDSMVELFLDWGCLEIQSVLLKMYQHSDHGFIPHFQNSFNKLYEFEVTDRHLGMELLLYFSRNHHQLFSQASITQLLDMYPEENQLSQTHILTIIHNIASKGPSLLTAGHFSMLVDSKLPPLSVVDRAPVLGQFAQQSEEYRKLTLEHLMSYVGHKDGAVCLAAMETLVPLLKDNPGYVKKQKTKFKNLWKTSDNDKVKDLCVKLVPDLSYQGKSKPVTAPVKTKPVPSVKPSMPAKPAVPSRLNTPASAARSLSSTHASSRTSTSVSAAGDTPANTNKLTADTETKKIDFGVSKTVQKESSNVKNVQEKTIDSNKRPNISKNVSDVPQRTVVSIGVSETQSIVKPEQPLGEDLQDNLNGALKPDSKGKPRRNSDEISNTKYNQDNKELLNENDTDKLDDGMSGNKEVADKFLQIESSTAHGAASAAVCIRLIGSGDDADRLSAVLFEAGYSNYVDTGDTLHNDVTGATRVVIFCVGDITAMTAEKWKSVLLQINQHDLPVIILKMKQLTLAASSTLKTVLLKEKCCIRFYLKTGEESFKGNNWPKQKICQLLMQLNYNGVLHDSQLIKPEYKDLWKQPVTIATEQGLSDKQLTIMTSSPDVFISYHWGKQRQVEPLFWYLSQRGVQCWMSVYHMFGSESLYNQISQGLHSCRAVIVCVTNNYTKSANCQQEINITQALNKPLIPLILGETKWPPDGDLGITLKKYTPLRVNLTHKNIVDKNSAAFVKLLQLLSDHVPVTQNTQKSNEDTHVSDPNKSDTGKPPSQDSHSKPGNPSNNKATYNQEDNFEQQSVNNTMNPQKTPRSSRYSKRSSSMFEIKKSPEKGDPILDNRTLPRGVTLDEMDYAMKSNRSKSCVIL